MKGNCYVCTLLPHSSHSTRLDVKVPNLEYYVECVLSAVTLLLDVQKWRSPMQCFNPDNGTDFNHKYGYCPASCISYGDSNSRANGSMVCREKNGRRK